MQKLKTLKPGDRFMWGGRKYQLLATSKKPGSRFCLCVETPVFDANQKN